MEKDLSFDRIEQYLTGTLEVTERTNFEKDLKINKQLMLDTALAKDLNEALDDAPLEQQLLAKLEVLGEQYITPVAITTQSNSTRNKKSLIIGLIIGLLTALGIFWAWQATKTKTPAQIYASYYVPYAAGEVTRGENITSITYQQGIDYYEAKNYEAAISIFEQSSNQLPVKILLGNSYLNITPARTEEAITLFKAIVADKSHVFIETSEWYLGLALLKNGQKEEAKTVFSTLAAKERGKYSKLAKEVLKNL